MSTLTLHAFADSQREPPPPRFFVFVFCWRLNNISPSPINTAQQQPFFYCQLYSAALNRDDNAHTRRKRSQTRVSMIDWKQGGLCSSGRGGEYWAKMCIHCGTGKSFTREHPHCTRAYPVDRMPLCVYSLNIGWVLPQGHHIKVAYRAFSSLARHAAFCRARLRISRTVGV